MEVKKLILIKMFIVQYLSVLCAGQDFGFFYFVLQWPGSYYDTKQSCCYPQQESPLQILAFMVCGQITTMAPTHQTVILISNLVSRMQKNWPTLACPSGDGSTFWSHEWNKHGTCSESVFDQHSYFKSALDLKDKLNLLQLQDAGIHPDGGSYNLSSVNAAVKGPIGYNPGIECNVDGNGNSQLYQVYICVDTSGANLIDCPVLPNANCASSVEFPTF